MRRLRRAFVGVVAAGLLVAPGVSAAPGGGAGNDPCTKTNGNVPPPCENVPEAPAALVYAGAGAGVLLVFAGVGVRARRRRPAAGVSS